MYAHPPVLLLELSPLKAITPTTPPYHAAVASLPKCGPICGGILLGSARSGGFITQVYDTNKRFA